MKRLLTTALKIALSAAILAYLVWNALRTSQQGQENVFWRLVEQPKQWDFLAAAGLVTAVAVVLTLVRWWYLVRALELPCRLGNALRLGFLGFLFNLAPMGIVGGDLLKAVLLARQHRENRARAVASVVADRLIGLYALFVVASLAILLSGMERLGAREVQLACRAVFALTALGTLAGAALLTPGVTEGRLSHALGRLPRIGPSLGNLIDAVRMYRRKPGVLGVSIVGSLGIHCLFVLGVYLIARGLPGDDLSLGAHCVVVPVAASTGILPLPLGPFEMVLEFFYTHLPAGESLIPAGQGLVVALVYRLINVLIAALGLGYYLGSRREVAEVLQETREAEQRAAQGECGDDDGAECLVVSLPAAPPAVASVAAAPWHCRQRA